MPRLPEEYAVWMGHVPSTEEVREAYKVDQVFYVDEMAERLKEMQTNSTLLLLNGTNSDSGKNTRTAAFDGMSKFQVINFHNIIPWEMNDLI